MIQKISIIAAIIMLICEPSFGMIENNVSSGFVVTFDESLPLPVKNAIGLFTKEVQKRVLPSTGSTSSTKQVLRVSVNESLVPSGLSGDALKKDGYYLKIDSSEIVLFSRNAGGAAAGLGRLLCLMDFSKPAITVPNMTLVENPAMTIRGIYFATHFNNYYECAPIEDIKSYIEEMALWGCNSLLVWFDPEKYKGFDDPKALSFIARLKQMEQTAHQYGMQFGLTVVANEAFLSSPRAIRSPRPSFISRNYYICPCRTGAMEYEADYISKLLESIENVDNLVVWCYDPGGCDCDQCAPYAGNGYIKLAEQTAAIFKKKNPIGHVYLSDWYIGGDKFDVHKGNAEKFIEYLKSGKGHMFDGVLNQMSPWHSDLPKAIIKAGVNREQCPMLSFMDISMINMRPWGGYGSNPLGDYIGTAMQIYTPLITGGWPYSEGIYEDVNKFQWFRKCWNPKESVAEIYKEYASFHFGQNVAGKAAQLFDLLEKTHKRKDWDVDNLKESAAAWALAQYIDANIATWAKSSWRWRIVYLRAAVDNCLATSGIKTQAGQDKIKPFLDEIVSIYHAELISGTSAGAHLRPPKLPPISAANNVPGR